MNNDSYNEYIRSVLGNTSNDNDLRYPDEDKSYYCDYSHPKNNMEMYENQNNNQKNNMQDYNIMYSDYPNRYGMPNYYDYADYPNGYNYQETRNMNEIEECYPEIYGIVYPMVKKTCRNISQPVSKEEVEKMVEELYGNLEGNNDVDVNITLNNNIGNTVNAVNTQEEQNRNTSKEAPNNNVQELKNQTQYSNQSTRQNNRSTGLFKPNVEPKREIPSQSKIAKKQETLEKTLQEPKETRYCNNGLCDIIRILLVRELLSGPNRPRPPYPPFGPGPGPMPPFEPGGRPIWNR